MRTIIDKAESVLQAGMEHANERIKMKFIVKRDEHFDLFSLRTYAMHESRSNPDFFKWLFDNPDITFFGTSLSEAQREEFHTWLHDL